MALVILLCCELLYNAKGTSGVQTFPVNSLTDEPPTTPQPRFEKLVTPILSLSVKPTLRKPGLLLPGGQEPVRVHINA
jgi:hypothetical protein